MKVSRKIQKVWFSCMHFLIFQQSSYKIWPKLLNSNGTNENILVLTGTNDFYRTKKSENFYFVPTGILMFHQPTQRNISLKQKQYKLKYFDIYIWYEVLPTYKFSKRLEMLHFFPVRAPTFHQLVQKYHTYDSGKEPANIIWVLTGTNEVLTTGEFVPKSERFYLFIFSPGELPCFSSPLIKTSRNSGTEAV